MVVDDRIYAFGGEGNPTGTGIYANNQEYDPSTDSWREVAPMITPRHGTDGALVGNTVYAPAGGTEDGVHDSAANETFTIDMQGSWTTLPSLPAGEQRREGGVVVLGDQLYVIGGNKGNEERTPTVLRYDIASETWAHRAPSPRFRGRAGPHRRRGSQRLDLRDGRLGGEPGSGCRHPVEVRHRVNTWTQLADMPDTHGAVGAAVIGGKIYAAGGTHGGDQVADLHVYDPVTDSWEIEAPMPTTRDHVVAANLDGKLYAFGGFIGVYPAGVTDAIEVYDPHDHVVHGRVHAHSSRRYRARGRQRTGAGLRWRQRRGRDRGQRGVRPGHQHVANAHLDGPASASHRRRYR